NGFSHVSMFQTALGAEEGTLSLSLTETIGQTSAFPHHIAAREIIRSIEVPCVPLDRLIAADDRLLGTRDLPLIKMDAEGSEPLIWPGMRQLIHKYRPI